MVSSAAPVLDPSNELSVSGGRSVSTSTSHRVPWGRGSFLPSSSPLASRRLTVAVERPRIRDASVTVSSTISVHAPLQRTVRAVNYRCFERRGSRANSYVVAAYVYTQG